MRLHFIVNEDKSRIWIQEWSTLKLIMAGDKWGRTAVLFLIGEEFMVCFLLLNIIFHLSLRPLEAVWLFLAHLVCRVFSRPYTNCGQLVKEASHRPNSPLVSITAGFYLSSPSHISPSLLPAPFPIFLLSLGIVIGPCPEGCLPPHPSHGLHFIFMSWGLLLWLCVTFPLGVLCHVVYLTRPSEMD